MWGGASWTVWDRNVLLSQTTGSSNPGHCFQQQQQEVPCGESQSWSGPFCHPFPLCPASVVLRREVLEGISALSLVSVWSGYFLDLVHEYHSADGRPCALVLITVTHTPP